LGRFFDRINKIYRIGKDREFLTGKHEGMKNRRKTGKFLDGIKRIG
jgi:hypothetical protein